MKPRQPDTLLSSDVSVPQYLELEKLRDQVSIADFVHQRFHERYIQPFKENKNKHGFIMMASSCLMIEALESFWQGWRKSPNSALAFCQFFDRSERFLALRGVGQQFYINIRCGIMHQGETTGGWHIRRDLDALFEPESLTVDAARFLTAMEGCLSDYRTALTVSGWDTEVWKNLRKKMKALCANTKLNE